MNRDQIKDEFLENIDAYIEGVEKINTPQDKEYKEIFEVGKLLASKDFSKNMNKDYIYDRCLKNINEGDKIMKKIGIVSKAAVVLITFAAVGVGFMQTSFAKDFSYKITKVVSAGLLSGVEVKEKKKEKPKVIMPANLKGKIFDKNGKAITEITKKNIKELYTSKGEKIAYISSGKIITENQLDSGEQVITDMKDINKYTCFKVVFPSYLPKGYKFDHAIVYKDNKGNISDKYISLYFTKPNAQHSLFVQERFACKETSYSVGDENVQKIKINNVDAIFSDDTSIDWQYNNCFYGISLKGVSLNELKKIAESIK